MSLICALMNMNVFFTSLFKYVQNSRIFSTQCVFDLCLKFCMEIKQKWPPLSFSMSNQQMIAMVKFITYERLLITTIDGNQCMKWS